jgi:hypothetical protein
VAAADLGPPTRPGSPATAGLLGVRTDAPGSDQAEASADLEDRGELGAEFPATNAGLGVALQPLRAMLAGEIRPALLILLGFVALILAIACANIANLQLARATARRREMSLRAASAPAGLLVCQLWPRAWCWR